MRAGRRADPSSFDSDARPRARTEIVVLAVAAGMFLAWNVADALLLVFSGLLLAAFLESCTRGLAKILPLPRGWNLALVVVAVSLGFAFLLVWSGISFVQQLNVLVDAVADQIRAIEHVARSAGLTWPGRNSGDPLEQRVLRLMFPSPQHLFGDARSALMLALGGAGEAVIVVLIGVFVAIDPGAYRRSIVELFPRVIAPGRNGRSRNRRSSCAGGWSASSSP